MLSRKTAVYKTSYAADLALQRVFLSRLAFWSAIALLLLMPLLVGRYALNVASLIMIAVVATIGLNILVGYAGHISVGHAGFALVGGFTVAITASRWDVPMLIGLPLAGIVAALVGAFFGIPSLRVKGLYLAIATLAAQFILEWFVQHAQWLTGLTGRQQTIYTPDPAITLPGLPPLPIASDSSRYYLFLALTISSFYAGVAGAMMAYHLGAVTYEPFTIVLSIQWLAMIIVGGLGSI